MNNRNKKYQINENIFNNIDSEEKAYFLGFLMADGYNNETRYSVRLCLKEEDVCVLESLKNILYPNNDKPIGYIKRKDGFNLNYLDICNKHISKTLANLGMIQAKTFKLQYPNISNTMNKHFIRGYFDGDGCINFFILKKYKYFKCQFRIIGTENFYFPVIVNSFDFIPKTERDGIWLKKDDDPEVIKNREILEKAARSLRS